MKKLIMAFLALALFILASYIGETSFEKTTTFERLSYKEDIKNHTLGETKVQLTNGDVVTLDDGYTQLWWVADKVESFDVVEYENVFGFKRYEVTKTHEPIDEEAKKLAEMFKELNELEKEMAEKFPDSQL